MAELEFNLKLIGINEIELFEECQYQPEYFTKINNDLRSILNLTKFDDVSKEINDFLESLPVNLITANILTHSYYPLPNEHELFSISVLTSNYNNSLFKLNNFYHINLLIDILYTILSGQTLYIYSIHLTETISFIERLSILFPFDGLFSYGNSDSKGFKSLIIGNPLENHSFKNTLDLDTRIFHGEKCPIESILRKEIIRTEHNENSFLVLLNQDIKRIGFRYIKRLAEISNRQNQCFEKIFLQMKSLGFFLSDIPILTFFAQISIEKNFIGNSNIHCFLNEKKF